MANDDFDSDDFFDQESKAHQQIAQALKTLPVGSRIKVLHSVMTLLGLSHGSIAPSHPKSNSTSASAASAPSLFSEDRTISPKAFLFEKQPKTDVERVACLAFYLTHYRNQPHFKTLDISKLNTEAAQRKFANSATAVTNAMKCGYLVSAAKGSRQLSAVGEQFVQALPDRDSARSVMTSYRPRKKSTKNKKARVD